MKNTAQLKALYEATKVNGRGAFCPRIGMYLIIHVYQSTCYSKSALMASARWKPNTTNNYDESFIVEIQLESFKGVSVSDKNNWNNREVVVKHAEYDKDERLFTLEWELLPIKTMSVADLNSLLLSDDRVANALLDSIDDVDVDDTFIDYNMDDDIGY